MRIRIFAATILVTAAAAFAAEGDWPKWGGPAGNWTTTEQGLLEKWPDAGPKELWRKTVGVGYSSPIAVDGRIYIFGTVEDKDRLTCMKAEDGEVLWTQETPGYTGNKGKYPGGRATPTVDGDRIYTFGGNGDLVCRQLADGKQLWSLDVMKTAGSKPPMWGNASCPAVIGEVVCVQAGEKGPIAIAVNKKTGEVAWQSEEQGQGSYAAMRTIDVEGTPQLLALCGTGCVAMDPATGKTLWKQPWATTYNINAVTPLYRDGHLFITSGYGTGCAMYKLDGKSSTEEWKKKEPHDRLIPPLLEKDVLYVHNEGSLMALSWPEGKEIWKEDLKLGIGGQYVRAGDKMIMLSDTGELMLAKVTPEGCTQISRVKMFESKDKDIWASPLVYRGKVYVKGQTELVCLDVAAK